MSQYNYVYRDNYTQHCARDYHGIITYMTLYCDSIYIESKNIMTVSKFKFVCRRFPIL